MRGPAPGRETELHLAREHGFVAAMDEVGRGALAGPVAVGVVVVDLAALARRAPTGLRDSKLLTSAQRESLVSRIDTWALSHAVGQASAQEIDAIGILGALRRAGERALALVRPAPDVVLLDGSHNWLTRRSQPVAQEALFDTEPALAFEAPSTLPRARREDPHPDHEEQCGAAPLVVTKVKADLQCAAVAAASVLAKVARDAVMVSLDEQHPEFGWRENKGYAASSHRDAIVRLGTTVWHRQSWRLIASDEDVHTLTL
jgi:ribonuclease HII